MNSKLTVNLGFAMNMRPAKRKVQQRHGGELQSDSINPIAASLPAGSGVIPYGVIQFAGIDGNPTACCNPSKTQFGPRFGSAYQLTPKTTLRAGIGIFYAPWSSGLCDSAPGFTQTTTYVASNNGNATPANSLSNPFPTGILQPIGQYAGRAHGSRPTFSYLDPNKTGGGTVYQYSADIQQELWQGHRVRDRLRRGPRKRSHALSDRDRRTIPINQLTPAQARAWNSVL